MIPAMPTLVEAIENGLLDGPTAYELSFLQRLRVYWWGLRQNNKWGEMTRLRKEGMTVSAAYKNALEI